MPNLIDIVAAIMGAQGVCFLVSAYIVRRDAPVGSRGYRRVARLVTKYRLLRPEALADERLMLDFVRARRRAQAALLLGFGLGSCLACTTLSAVAHWLRVTLDSPPGAFSAMMYLPELACVCGSVIAVVLFVRHAKKQPSDPIAPIGVSPRSYGVRWTLAVSLLCVFMYCFATFGALTGQIPTTGLLPGDVDYHAHPLVAWVLPVATLALVALTEGAGLWLRRQPAIRLTTDPAVTDKGAMYKHASEQFMRLESLKIYGGEALMLAFLGFAQTTLLADLGMVSQAMAIVAFLCSGLIIALVHENLKVR